MVEHSSSSGESIPMEKLLGRTGLKVRVALVSAAILSVGALIAPRATPTVLSAPEERAAPLIVEQVQQRDVSQPFRGVQDVGARVRVHSVAVPRPSSPSARTLWDFGPASNGLALPSGFGVVVTAQGDVLTHAAALRGRSTVPVLTSSGLLLEATLIAYERATGLALLRTPPEANVPMAPISTTPVQPGTLVAAAAHWDGRGIVLPAFITSQSDDSYTLSAAAGALAPGTPIYDMDGLLVAVAADGGASGTAHGAHAAVARLTARIATGRGRESSIGVAVQPLSEELTAVFGDTGALVSDVVANGPADLGGVHPGDLLLAIGDTPVESAESARQAIASLQDGMPSTVRVLRGSRVHTLPILVATAFDVASLASGVPAGDSTTLPEARAILSAAQLRASGIAPTARVVHINGRPVASPAQLPRELQGGEAVLVYLEHEGQRFFAVLPETP